MTATAPTFVGGAREEAGAADGPDRLGIAAMRALSREHPMQRQWGPGRTVVLGAVTFGVLPLYSWPRGLQTQATIERQQLWHLAEWVRLRSGEARGKQLVELAERVGFKPILWALSMLGVAVGAAFFVRAASEYGFGFGDLRASTYSLGRMTPPHVPAALAQQLFIAWTVGLCWAYTIHWFHLQLHAAQVRRFVEVFNEAAAGEGVRPVQAGALGMGVSPLWLIGAVALVSAGAVWGIPMCLAGALHGRWRRQSREIRGGLSEAVREILMGRRPAVSVPRPTQLGSFCPNELCRGRVPPAAMFCPRCGKAVAGGAGAGKVV